MRKGATGIPLGAEKWFTCKRHIQLREADQSFTFNKSQCSTEQRCCNCAGQVLPRVVGTQSLPQPSGMATVIFLKKKKSRHQTRQQRCDNPPLP